MLNKIFAVIMCVGLPYIAVTLGFEYLGNTGGFSMMIMSGIALFLIFKPQIFTIIGRRKYFDDHTVGFKWLKKAYNTGRMAPQQALVYAYLLLRDGHLTESEKLISAVLYKSKQKLTKQNLLAAELNLAIILWKKGNLKEAIEKLEGVYNEQYRSTVHYGTLGVFYIMANELEKAEEFCLEALDYNPGDMSIKDNLGLVYLKKGKLEEAKEIYEDLFEGGTPDFIEAYYNYGQVLEQLGDTEGAKEQYEKALSCPERYLSTVKLAVVDAALSKIE